MVVVLTTDDLNQDDWSLFEYFDKLHDEFPQMKLLAFFTPLWHHKVSDDELVNGIVIGENFWKPEFLEFLRERKEWLSLAAHGLFHINPDCYGDEAYQETMFKKCLKILSDLNNFTDIPVHPYFKAPWYRWKEFTPPLCFKCGYSRFYIPEGYYERITNEFPGKDGPVTKSLFPMTNRSRIGLVDTHVSITDRMENRIDRCYEKVRELLIDQYGSR